MGLKNWRQSRRFLKEFSSFDSGLQELTQNCNAINQSISAAMKALQIPPEVQVPLGWALSMQEAFTKFALLHQASCAPKFCRLVYCRANHEGFVYRTNSGFIFGWRKVGKTERFRFFVQLRSFGYSWVPATCESLIGLDWREVKNRNELPNLGLQGLLNLSTE